VQECIDGFSGQPFRVAEIAEMLGLDRSQVKVPIFTLLRAGVVSCVGENRTVRRSGRKEKLYAASETKDPTSDAAKIKGAVQRFSDRYEFSSTDISRDLKIRAETIVAAVEALEKSGIVVRVIDSRMPGRGRSAPRWTSNPCNMEEQRQLAYLSKNVSADDG
jgi:predicted transcriptional regulator